MNIRIFVLSTIAAAMSACGGGYGGAVDDGPPPDTTTGSVTELGVLTQNPLIRSRNGGGSFVFGDHSVWLFGDTLLDSPDIEGEALHSNSWSWTDDTVIADGILPFDEQTDALGAPTEFFPLTDDERAFNNLHRGNDNCQQTPCGARWALWPGHAVVDSASERTLVFYHKVYAEPGVLNFHSVGSSVAIWDNPLAAPFRPEVRPGTEHPTLLFSETEPSFGDAAILVGDTVYAYACHLDWLAKPCRLGRVQVGNILDRNAWTFYAGGNEWVSDVNAAVTLFNGTDIMSIAYNSFLQRYVAVYSEPLGTNVVMRTASKPEGPWTAAKTLFSARPPVNETGWIYDAVMHPEFESDGGRVIYVTYTRQTAPFESELRLVSVELEAVN